MGLSSIHSANTIFWQYDLLAFVNRSDDQSIDDEANKVNAAPAPAQIVGKSLEHQGVIEGKKERDQSQKTPEGEPSHNSTTPGLTSFREQ